MRNGKRAAGIVGLAVVGSRMLGLVRELVFAAMFGAGKHLDAFLAAFQIPNLMRDLFAEGALSTAFTTTFAKTWEKDGPAPAWRLTALVLSSLVVVVGALCLLGIVFSPVLVQITNFGFHGVEGKFELTVRLTRLLFPFILFVSVAAAVMGVLNARYVFGLPASASTVFNFVSVLTGVGLALAFGWRPHLPDDSARQAVLTRALYGVSIGVLLGGLCQLGMQLPALWKQGFRFRWHLDFKDPGLRQVWRLMWPSVIAGAAVQVNVLVNGMFASEIDGARSWLNCAFRLMQFPIGVFGVAIATVTLPSVSVHHARRDLEAFGKTLEEALRLAFFLTVPAAAGLFALAPDIIGLIYEHGRFLPSDTARTAAALRAFAAGLAGYAAIKVLVPCFYALDRPQTPLRVSALSIGVNLGMNFVLVKVCHLGHVGLAASTGALALINFAQLAWCLRRDINFGSGPAWGRLALAVGAASLLAGAAAWGSACLARDLLGSGLIGRIVVVGVGVGAGGLSYGLITMVCRVPETVSLLRVVRRRLRV